MFTRILTDLERRRIKRYLAKDGKKVAAVRMIANRGRINLPRIKEDVALLERLLDVYWPEKPRKRRRMMTIHGFARRIEEEQKPVKRIREK